MEMQIHAGESRLLKRCTGDSSLGNCFSTNCISSTPATCENALRHLSDKIGVWTRTGSGDSEELSELERTPLAKKRRTVAKDACDTLRDIKDLMDKENERPDPELELQRAQLEEQRKEREQRGETDRAMRDLLVRLIQPLQPAKSSNNIIN
ncbi:hypothetical protein M427DRAFT_52383 [Gonapodya prolifera JEL478]|uniref:Uncharacterized protein n=1 Tax=Gonapodya prolifera (strain JEL478) TaxID=1344416 RepID=A0A139ATS1_GONPJ|nr:hypothetical protein M427DRAFT_52383 [Gonapodya prolifera JEL478]|eukprot:KXS20122.1 hypothetical protein M427DRAFT_52383 [Gonapodya prolifera JEL478]